MIPHRYPFLMIDRVVDVVPDHTAVGIKNVSINEYFFQGHFPGHAVMPGVLLIEAMAQTAAVLVVHTLGPEAEGKLVYFMVLGEAAVLFGVGMLLGLGVALLLARGMRSFLYGIGPVDPPTYIAAAIVLAGVMFVAAFVPARRAMRVNPLSALRSD